MKRTQRLRTIHVAVGTAMMIGMVVAVFVAKQYPVADLDPSIADFLTLFVPLLAAGCISGGTFVYRRMMLRSLNDRNVRSKVTYLFMGTLIRDVLMETAGLVGSLAFYLSSEAIYLGIPALMILMFGLFMPTERRIIKDLSLSEEEYQEMKQL